MINFNSSKTKKRISAIIILIVIVAMVATAILPAIM